MKKLEIIVEDQDYQTIRQILQHIDVVKEVVDISLEQKQTNVTANIAREKAKAADTAPAPQPVDEISLLSQQALAEDWDSEEDDRYDELYKAGCKE